MKPSWTLLPAALLLLNEALAATNATYADSLPFTIDGSTPGGTTVPPTFPISGFTKFAGNPIITPNPANNFESSFTYNPTAIVLNNTIFLLYRAQNSSLTSSIGLAWSTDGTTFTRLNTPTIFATQPDEQKGGTEDPRIIRVNGTFYVTYTAYDGITPRLALATSTDLLNWTKHGPLFPNSPHSKSGAIIDEKASDGLYHMYFNDSTISHATSPDLLTWQLAAKQPFAAPTAAWDAGLDEPGPAPVRAADGNWILVYNGKASGTTGTAAGAYSTGQMLIDPTDDSGPLRRLDEPFLTAETAEERSGQVPDVVFSEGLVQFKGKWYLYYGQSDTTVGVAIADVQ